MVNTPQSIETKKSLKEQREELLKLNPDIVYWVYDLIEMEWKNIELSLLENTLCCYPNQLENLKWLDENSDISILDINALRKWWASILKWSNVNINKPILLSCWVIELFNGKRKDWTKSKDFFVLTLRDWWAADQMQRTNTAWRCSWDNLYEESMREHIEEAPFIWKDKNNNYALCIPETPLNNEDSFETIKQAIEWFLSKKYNLDKNNPEDKKMISKFEKKFKINYAELWPILEEIIKTKNIMYYKNERLENHDVLWKDMFNIKIWENVTSSYVYVDEANNTIEAREVIEFKWFPEWFKSLWSFYRLFTESRNQDPSVRSGILMASNVVPTVKNIWETYRKKFDHLFK